ncbi:MAG: hypothetical protein Q9169_006942 [Polycauliona sp. 2 TL-2023]
MSEDLPSSSRPAQLEPVMLANDPSSIDFDRIRTNLLQQGTPMPLAELDFRAFLMDGHCKPSTVRADPSRPHTKGRLPITNARNALVTRNHDIEKYGDHRKDSVDRQGVIQYLETGCTKRTSIGYGEDKTRTTLELHGFMNSRKM